MGEAQQANDPDAGPPLLLLQPGRSTSLTELNGATSDLVSRVEWAAFTVEFEACFVS
jgi:hypothetical protein